MFRMQLNNVFAIDSYMFGYAHYMSCYLIKGKELALVDTGMPEHLKDVLNGIRANGFRVEDIKYIFVADVIRERNLQAAENFKNRGDKKLSDYATKEHIPPQAQTFAEAFLHHYVR